VCVRVSEHISVDVPLKDSQQAEGRGVGQEPVRVRGNVSLHRACLVAVRGVVLDELEQQLGVQLIAQPQPRKQRLHLQRVSEVMRALSRDEGVG
jgi:hypothetical protein